MLLPIKLTDRQKYRLLEMIPATATWVTLVGAVVLSIVNPLAAIALVLLFDLYWLLRVLYFVFFMSVSWTRYHREEKKQWFTDLQKNFPVWSDYYHVIFLPTYKEGLDVIQATCERIRDSHYDPKKFIIVLAGEERDKEQFQRHAEHIKEEFGETFYKLIVTVHPSNLPGEIVGKGSNLNYAGYEVKKYIDETGIPYEKFIVSAFDIDTVVHPEYFSCLTYTYLSQPDPQRCSYQPAVLYNNNLWESPAPVRIAALGTTFWLMTELPRPERMFTFSSHSMSWQALVDVGFWEKRIVTEDSRIFLQCLLHYDGNYRVEPMYVPVSMDAVSAGSYWESIKALYKQQRRWAWGVEHLPFMLWNFSRRPNIPWRTKLYYTWNLGEGMYTWATAPIIITMLGYIPGLFLSQTETQSAFAQNAPFILENLLQLSMLGLFISVFMSLWLLPRRPGHVSRSTYLVMILQWLLLPITLTLFGSIPAIDAQTRLFLGKYLGFNVTQKVRNT